MKFLLINAGPPGSFTAADGSGAAIGTWAITRQLLDAGHNVSICHIPLLGQRLSPGDEADLRRRVSALEKLGVAVDLVPVPLVVRPSQWQQGLDAIRAAARPRITDFYPYARVKPAVQRIVETRKPDAIYLHSTNTLATTDGYTVPPRLAMTGDLDDLVLFYRWRLTPLRSFPRYVYRFLRYLAARRLNASLMPMLARCESVISVAQHIVPLLREQGVDCKYLPNPWAGNPVEPLCLLSSPDPAAGRKPRILMAGHLAGTATLSGLYFLANEALPRFERRLGVDKFEIHILGRDPLPADLQRKFDRPAIRLRGYVDDILQEYVQADLMLVTTPIVIGARTRIAEAFSLGCCVVAHTANAPGMPEMIHGHNCLLADNGAAMAEAVVSVLEDPGLRRRLQENGRATWEQYYAPDKAISRVTQELVRIASGPLDVTRASLAATS